MGRQATVPQYPQPSAFASRGEPHGLKAIWAISLVAAFLTYSFSPNPELGAVAFIALAVVLTLLWHTRDVPILIAISAFQFLQIAMAIWIADFYGVPVGEEFQATSIGTAVLLSLGGLVAQAAGMYASTARMNMPVLFGRDLGHEELSIRRIFLAYLIAVPVTVLASQYTFVFGGLSQIILALLSVKYVLLMLLLLTVVLQQRSYGLLLAATGIELLIGAGGFFSGGFMNALLILLLALGCFVRRISVERLLLVLSASAVTLVIATAWTAVKPEYRRILNQDSGDQFVAIAWAEAIGELGTLLARVDGQAMVAGVDALARRVSYVEIFGDVIDYVPHSIPHEDGRLWLDAIRRVVQPRLLFENKKIIDDIEQTAIYTGWNISPDMSRDTSISIGYFGESYIDFGKIGMLCPLFLVGFMWGGIYRRFVEARPVGILGIAIATAILMSVGINFGNSAAKLFGWTVTVTLVMLLLQRFGSPMIVRLLKDPVRPGRQW